MGYKPSIVSRLLVLTTLFSSLVFSTTSLAFSLSDLFGGSDDEQVAASTANPLTDILSSQLGVTQEQAAGGAGALLSLASSQLSGDQASELSKMIPGSDALSAAIPPGLSGMLTNIDTINQVFSALGMDASMVSQFIPVVMQFLGSQGASAGLMDALGKVWSPTG
ncbi:DUF2780 domain-containing protein [Photobacterium chitinilyticum]|uniref:DUF2780 domain-containing protein n=1 Tax=Photobacterium chitinilyticum TaxID=2485123 RepID=A0A444JIV3_9GAMM|nr:DUF2780 domain-containing protein [Photobacterium chitinilyticum]RWX53008.1 DUF2780 domain-containing protein [Photobacterium chitinilyticum]